MSRRPDSLFKAIPLLGTLLFISAGALAEEEMRNLVDDARRASIQLLTQIRGEVTKEMDRTGPIRAIVVCKYSAPEITSVISRQTGMRVTRVALRVRNRALGEADPWEQQALLDFEKRLAKGEKAESLEAAEIINEPAGKVFRYAKAIPMGQPCLACHGPVTGLSDAVKAQLATEYPHDRAVDFQLGQIRGAVSVKKSL
ncbi:MAG: DUF3365 domain-containing protein [Rhizobiales bacterium]|jgi:hypothetical protein|nr:DUF3365 domain-containing protein [Hyphomicrobiales bacterium]